MANHISLYISPEQLEQLRSIANRFGYRHGSRPSISQLCRAIAGGELTVSNGNEEPNTIALNGSEIDAIKHTPPETMAKRHADIAHVALEAECPELAQPHVELALAYALIATTLNETTS